MPTATGTRSSTRGPRPNRCRPSLDQRRRLRRTHGVARQFGRFGSGSAFSCIRLIARVGAWPGAVHERRPAEAIEAAQHEGCERPEALMPLAAFALHDNRPVGRRRVCRPEVADAAVLVVPPPDESLPVRPESIWARSRGLRVRGSPSPVRPQAFRFVVVPGHGAIQIQEPADRPGPVEVHELLVVRRQRGSQVPLRRLPQPRPGPPPNLWLPQPGLQDLQRRRHARHPQPNAYDRSRAARL